MRPPFLGRRKSRLQSLSPGAQSPPPALNDAAAISLSRKPLVRALFLLSGSFDDEEIRVCLQTKDESKEKSPPKHTHSLPPLSEVSRDDDDDDDHDEADENQEEMNSRTNGGAELGAIGNVAPSEDILSKMVQSLTNDEVEVASSSSYAYVKLARSLSEADSQLLHGIRRRAAFGMAARHWMAEKGDTELAVRKMRNTLAERPKAHAIRHCFENDDLESLGIRRRVQHYVGPRGRMFVRGFDPEGRAVFHFIARNSPRNPDPAEGCNEANCFILEKAIACTERRTGGRLSSIVLSADLSEFQKWQAPPLSCVREMLEVLQHHYPERMHRIYVVNAPRLFWGLWSIVKPFVDPNTKAKVQFVSSMEHVLDKDQAMPYQRFDGDLTHPVDIGEFFRLPLDWAYDELQE